MPFVHIELVEGRSGEALTKMMEEVTEAVHRNTGAPKEHIHIIINEMKKGNYAVDGKWK
ncbi:4-oxalocrotonate tautomerase family enzyme [Enterococcus asini ATCC 700915]|uniref:Tautomerase n=1 Tax=Enterococcus asini ATCC 700915 TaxID=1158606 RepID=R2PU07_9ENTE|nr:2-hydroxymuconate tautomerase [Enterococcus asini]EOH88047.1 4-oxalocrotonate tautomerase family enzyme [Enterococcus asini ATCC 700915]EOT55844.1 4-oxalocrotonate tautomerase [Enterococcus asini ATCC 700915]OJG12822.1 4-oxalocrotonate tautomerase family enzyme [Enterococcus asini]